LVASLSKTKTSDITEVIVLMVEHLEFCSPLIRDEIGRWHDLLWEDYLYYQQGESKIKELETP